MSDVELRTWVELFEVRTVLNKLLGTGAMKRMSLHGLPSLAGLLRMTFADPDSNTRPLFDQTENELAIARALIRLDDVLEVLSHAPTVVGKVKPR